MLYLLPGMGASSKMYTNYKEWAAIENVKFLDWPTWNGEESIEEIALSLIERHSINSKDILAGSSLGGMVALEVAKIVQAEKAILIGSAVNPSEVNRALIALSPLASLTPVKFIQFLCGKYNSELISMFTQTDADFIKNMCLAIKDWPGAGEYSAIARIHGVKDLVISCPENTVRLEGGGHLIAMTHPAECVEILKTMIEDHKT